MAFKSLQVFTTSHLLVLLYYQLHYIMMAHFHLCYVFLFDHIYCKEFNKVIDISMYVICLYVYIMYILCQEYITRGRA